MFRRAAYYDSQAAHVPFQAIKEGGNRNQAGVNPDEFKKILVGKHQEGDKSSIAEGGAASLETNTNPMERGSMNSRVVKDTQTAEGEMLNIGIVELPPGAESR